MGVSLIVSALIFSVIPLKNQLRRSYLYALMLQLLILILYLVVISLCLSSTIVYGTVLIGQLLLGLSITLGNIPYQILLQHTVDEAYKSRVFSVNQSFVSALVPLSYMLFGFLLPLSFTFTLVGCAVSMGLIVIIFLKKIYRNA
ncbi:MFS transporter [Staphylococcus hyicus]|uniref:MFS transporter n=1 Tax=Staphylococcus hyicus TaxID=1284 RepID=UPI0011598DB1|nr:MFS transporter [Staphylococcus hyicus]